eukprot:6184605-Pleurochrysis_carterae.AAC.2
MYFYRIFRSPQAFLEGDSTVLQLLDEFRLVAALSRCAAATIHSIPCATLPLWLTKSTEIMLLLLSQRQRWRLNRHARAVCQLYSLSAARARRHSCQLSILALKA